MVRNVCNVLNVLNVHNVNINKGDGRQKVGGSEG